MQCTHFDEKTRIAKNNSKGHRLLCNANDTAGEAGASVAGGLGELVAALAEVVNVGMDLLAAEEAGGGEFEGQVHITTLRCTGKTTHHNSAANDRVGAGELDKVVGNGELGNTIGASLNVAEVASVTESGKETK